MAKRRSQSEHDRMVTYTANFLVQKDFRNVKADVPGYPTPEIITWKSTGKGHIPDVTGEGAEFNLFEVETADSINDQHTEDQWTLFAAFAKQHESVFWVVVPKGSESAAQQRLKELKINAKIWEV